MVGKKEDEPKAGKANEVGAVEDLMREHGVLNRVFLIYEEVLRRLASPGLELKPSVIKEAAAIVRDFIEEYHEELEEEYVFPRFEKSEKKVALVKVLDEQHHAGRRLTKDILRLATDETLKDMHKRYELSTAIQEFIRMYRPHGSQEDTVLFPAFHEIVPRGEYAALSEEFEKKEHDLFGKEGYKGVVERVTKLEKSLGLSDLSKFTVHA